jgi:hypothetical protein
VIQRDFERQLKGCGEGSTGSISALVFSDAQRLPVG